jgi:hypothetical protein
MVLLVLTISANCQANCKLQESIFLEKQTRSSYLTDYALLPNGLIFMSTTYSCFVLSRVENYFATEPNDSKKQIRPGKHGNTICICPWHAQIS